MSRGRPIEASTFSDTIKNSEYLKASHDDESELRSSSRGSSKSYRHRKLPLSALCDTCKHIFHSGHDEEWFDEWHGFHADWAAFQHAATKGCSVCSHLRRRISSMDIHGIEDENARIALQFKIKDTLEGCSLCISYSHIDDRSDSTTRNVVDNLTELKLMRIKGSEDGFEWIDAPRKSKNRQIWAMCQRWLDTCQSKHRRCGDKGSASSFRPSRLLYVYQENGSIKARLSCEEGPSEAYLTLSHCWGTKAFFTLKQENLPDLLQDIPIALLPRVFQDALYATLKLGFSWIWIDSLCIIQDSRADWLRESAVMGEIFKYATCNLAATGFPDGQHGLSAKRNVSKMVCLVAAYWTGTWRVWLEETFPRKSRQGEYYVGLVESLWEDEVEKAPLNRRGWVVQERLLSPRTIHFGRRQILWECFEDTFCELFPHGFPDGSRKSFNFKTMPIFHRSYFSGSSPVIVDSWHSVVERYSRGKLTYAEDKAIALSGMAQEVQRMIRSRYLAGLWQSNVLDDLLWMCRPDLGASVSYPHPPRAPSWSWTSVDGDIFYHHFPDVISREEHSSFVGANIDYEAENEFGSVRGGYIRLRGPLVDAQLDDKSDPALAKYWHIGGRAVVLHAKFDFTPSPSGQSSLRTTRMSEESLKYEVGRHWFSKFLSTRTLYVLPIQTSSLQRMNSIAPNLGLRNTGLYSCGLILTRTRASDGEYIRLGMYVVEDEDGVDTLLRPRMKLPPSAYESVDKSEESYIYTIKIV